MKTSNLTKEILQPLIDKGLTQKEIGKLLGYARRTICANCVKLKIEPNQNIEVVFLSKVIKTNNCWEWNGSKNNLGYGSFKFKGFRYSAHRCSYAIYKGDIPDNLVIRHTCDNPSCVNPEHLLVGTQKDNSEDMMQRGRNKFNHAPPVTHCKHGHGYDLENTIYNKNNPKHRICKKCRDFRNKEYQRKLKNV